MTAPATLDRSYSYKVPSIAVILVVLFFTVCGAFFLHQAQTNDRGLIVNGILRFDTAGATVIYWILCLASFGMVATGLLMSYFSIVNPHYLKLTDGGLVAFERYWSKNPMVIPYSHISEIREKSYRGHDYIKIYYPGGVLTINPKWFQSDSDYDEFKAMLIQCLKGALTRT